MKNLLASVLLCLPLLAHAHDDAAADCQAHLATWMKTLHPGRELDTEHAACKIWPADPSLTLAVQPMLKAGGSADDGVYDVEILVADSQSGAIVAHRYEPAAITSDAVALSGINLDTARYQLTPQLRAFGVRVSYDHMSSAAPFEAEALSLYVLEGHTLRRVLGNLGTLIGSGESDTRCVGHYTKTVRTVAIGAPGASGYATLHIGESSVNSVSKEVSGDCVSTDHPSKRTGTTLDYDGNAYPVPKPLQYE